MKALKKKYLSLDQDQRLACWFVLYGAVALLVTHIWPVA